MKNRTDLNLGEVVCLSTVREIAKTVYIKSCDMIGRAKTKTNHIGREGLKTSKNFSGKKGSHISPEYLRT